MANKKSPGQAIQAAMEEQGITRADLVKALGSRGRVSDLLNDKREPTLREIKMLRGLLGVNADELIVDFEDSPESAEPDWTKFPLKEMVKRGWIDEASKKKGEAKAVVLKFAEKVGIPDGIFNNVAFRNNLSGSRSSDHLALQAWLIGARLEAQQASVTKQYSGNLDSNFLKTLIEKSVLPKGPLKAKEFLAEHGIKLVIVPHFKKTYLDGAVFFIGKTPVIGLTLRYDRRDYFWFTLLHEVAHITLGHVSLKANGHIILDNFEDSKQDDDDREQAANKCAMELAMPDFVWEEYESYFEQDPIGTMHRIADKMKIDASIVAGQIRYRLGDYRVLSQHIGSKTVRMLFPEAFPV